MVVFPVELEVLTTLIIPRPSAVFNVVLLELANDRVTLLVFNVVVDTTLTTLTRRSRTDDEFAVPLRTPTSITQMAVVKMLRERFCWHADTDPVKLSETIASSLAVSIGAVVAFSALMDSG
jgi:hypothetical protein